MRAIGVIPARIGSTRLRRKALLAETGRTLIEHVHDAARQARRLDAVIVATDDAEIAEVVRRFGGTAVMTPVSCPSGTDRVALAVANHPGDIVVNIQGDEPEMAPSTIDAVVEAVASDPRVDIATAAAPLSDLRDFLSPAVVKVVCDAEGFALYFSRAPIPAARDGGPEQSLASGLALCHAGIYAFRRGALCRFVEAPPSDLERCEQLEQLRALHLGFRIRVVKVPAVSRGIDTPEDYEAFRLRATARTRG